jgi:structural maintenance of chromosome 2
LCVANAYLSDLGCSSDFGGIFAELLPGNFAKLQPPENQDLMDGLEIKVQLGSVWKQSLTELSGGQRYVRPLNLRPISPHNTHVLWTYRLLIALSLIMALLQFKPAPVYILDEIDAALDLSHTQHIGTLFRTRFRGAQFIVVSFTLRCRNEEQVKQWETAVKRLIERVAMCRASERSSS